MPSTSGLLLPYPALTAAPNVPADIQALADRLEALFSPTGAGSPAWTAFTPVLAQGVGLAIAGNTTRWKQEGKRVTVHYSFQVNAAGTATAGMSLSLPTAALAIGAANGSGSIFYQDVSVPQLYVLQPTNPTTTSLSFLNVPGGVFGNNSAVTAAAGDLVNGTLVYEAA